MTQFQRRCQYHAERFGERAAARLQASGQAQRFMEPEITADMAFVAATFGRLALGDTILVTADRIEELNAAVDRIELVATAKGYI